MIGDLTQLKDTIKFGAIYGYKSPERWMYVGSVQNATKLGRRHQQHVQLQRGMIGKWLNANPAIEPFVLENVKFEKVEELFERENYWITTLGTRVKNGGLNRVPAGGEDHAMLARLGGGFSNAGRVLRELYGDRQREWCIRASKQSLKVVTKAMRQEMGRRGGTRTHQTHPNQSRENGLRMYGLHPDWASANGKKGAIKGHHIRWHVSRGITNPNCKLCGSFA